MPDRAAEPAALEAVLATGRRRRWPRIRARAAVALVITPGDELLLVRRADRPGDPWSGHVSFPGGRALPGEHDPEATARREMEEEVGIAPGRTLGRLGDRLVLFPGRLSPLVITPVVFELAAGTRPGTSAEVTRSFLVPLAALASGRLDALHRFRLGRLPFPARSFRFDGEVIWGLTYQILRELLRARALAVRVGGRG